MLDSVPNIKQIRIGIAVSLTGRYAYPGKQALAGVQAWIQHVNRIGGLGLGDERLPVDLVHYDDASRAQRCEELTRRLIRADKVDVLIGPYSSGFTIRAAKVANDSGQLLWNHGGALGSRAQGKVVDILSPASTYFHGVIDYALSRSPNLVEVTIVHSTAGEFPRQLAAGSLEYCSDKRLPLPSVLTYAANTKRFDTILEHLREQRPELLLVVGRIEDDVEFVRQLHQAELGIEFVGVIAAPLTFFGEELGEAADGILGPSQWEPGVDFVPEYGPAPAEVVEELAGVGQSIVDYPGAQAFAGCLVAQRCIETAASLDPKTLWATAGRLDTTTFYGRFRINAQTGRQEGHVMPVIQWRDGHKVPVWPL